MQEYATAIRNLHIGVQDCTSFGHRAIQNMHKVGAKPVRTTEDRVLYDLPIPNLGTLAVSGLPGLTTPFSLSVLNALNESTRYFLQKGRLSLENIKYRF